MRNDLCGSAIVPFSQPMPPKKVVRVQGYVVEFSGFSQADPRCLFQSKEEAERWAERVGGASCIVKVDGFAHVDHHLRALPDPDGEE